MLDKLSTLANSYEKILSINLQDATFQEIKVKENERVNYKGINQWFIQFANSTKMSPADRERFLKFANIETIKTKLIDEDEIDIVYQRKINNELRWCIMSVYRTENQNEALLTVKDIQNCISDIENQKNRGHFNLKEELYDFVNDVITTDKPLGLIILEYNDDDILELIEVFNYYFNINNIYQYNSNHVIIPIEENSLEKFIIAVSQIYKDFSTYDVNIGSVWRDKGWDYIEIMGALSANLQINKPTKKEQ